MDPRMPFWLDAPCPPWCTVQKHRASDVASIDEYLLFRARVHRCMVGQVTRTTEPANHISPQGRPRTVEVYLVQGVREIGPRVVLWAADEPLGRSGAPGVDSETLHALTQGEAWELSELLQRAVRIAERS
jgi:hypothetical protein